MNSSVKKNPIEEQTLESANALGFHQNFKMGQALTHTHNTYVTIKNDTGTVIKTKVREIKDEDWVGEARPDHNLHDLTIAPGEHITKQAVVNAFHTANMYTLDLIMNETAIISCRVDQGAAYPRTESFGDYSPFKSKALRKIPIPGAEAVACVVDGITEFADREFEKRANHERGKLDVEFDNTDEYEAKIAVKGRTVEITVFREIHETAM